jgi:hypothetical protein
MFFLQGRTITVRTLPESNRVCSFHSLILPFLFLDHSAGNKRYREMVEDRKMDYVTSKRLDKPLVALQIIRTWREQDPPGRFLKVDEKTGLWGDVGDKKAREKTSQALREKAPLLRKQHEGAQSDEEGSDEVCTSRSPSHAMKAVCS